MMVLPLLFLGGFLPLGSVGSRSRGSELGALTDLVLGAAGLPAVCFLSIVYRVVLNVESIIDNFVFRLEMET